MDMFNRPKPGEKEDDVLDMQKAYLAEKQKNPNIQPAAKVINARKHPATNCENNEVTGVQTKKRSKFAENRSGLSTKLEENKDDNLTNVLGDVFERTSNSSSIKSKLIDDVFYPIPKGGILGDVIEKKDLLNKNSKDVAVKTLPMTNFPEVKRISSNYTPKNGLSIFAQEMLQLENQTCKKIVEEMDTDVPTDDISKSDVLLDVDKAAINQQNNEILSKMTIEEIEEERQKLLNKLDPGLIDFLKNRQTKKNNEAKIDELISMKNVNNFIVNSSKQNDCDMEGPLEATNEVLSHPLSHTWVHFDQCESEKLKWTTDIKIPKNKLNSDDTYEARFDFIGALLEYNPEKDHPRELYHHGEEPHRPGYSMKELFKLTRSQVQQQRIIALNCLAGILERHTLGSYWFLDLPLAKIYFVIRFAMDDNAMAALEPALKAMRSFFWNHIDEACLDSTVFLDNLKHPLLNSLTKARQSVTVDSEDRSLINYTPEQNEEEEMTDYHIAENDIIQCALRTDLLPRIRYILSKIRPNITGVEYCLEILVRLARESINEVNQILKCEGILETIISEFLPDSIHNIGRTDIAYGTPITLAMKLIRIIASHSESIAKNLYKKYFRIIVAIQCYLSAIIEVNISTVTLQIESMNTWAVFLSYGVAQVEFDDMFPVIMRQVDYHVRATNIIENSSTLLQSHGAALLNLISNCHSSVKFLPIIISGLCNWSQQIIRIKDYSSGHLRLITSAFNCTCNMLTKNAIQNGYITQELKTLNEKYIMQMINSIGFENLCSNICESSNLLSGVTEKERQPPGATQISACLPEYKNVLPPVLGAKSPILFLATFFKYALVTNKYEIFEALWNNKNIQKYLQNIANSQLFLISHWFTRMEYDFIINILKVSLQIRTISLRSIIFSIAYKLAYLLNQEFQADLVFLMKDIIFNKEFFSEEKRLENICLENGLNLLAALKDIVDCYINVLGLQQISENKLTFFDWNHSILPLDWTYMPILGFYTSSQDKEKCDSVKEEQQKDIIKCCLQWVLISESYIPDQTSHMSTTDRFCRLLCVYLCHNSLFLDEDIKPLLSKCILKIFQIVRKQPLDFNKPLQGLSSFTDLYTQVLEHYQAVSYGDEMFSACVLVPLAHCHNICWRKQIWSEHSGLLRVLNCSEEMLCYPLQAYLEPIENDDSLLSCYKRALHGLLRPNTIPYKIAYHHVRNKK